VADLVVTHLTFVILLRVCLSSYPLGVQWLSLCLQVVGLVVVLWDPNPAKGGGSVRLSLAPCLLLLLSVTITALCSVWNEFVVKSFAANLMAQVSDGRENDEQGAACFLSTVLTCSAV
jgi:hypothetical protein